MRKILSNCPVSCFADEISVSLDRQIQVLNELGIKFVEFRSADGTGVADFTDEQAKEMMPKNSGVVDFFHDEEGG